MRIDDNLEFNRALYDKEVDDQLTENLHRERYYLINSSHDYCRKDRVNLHQKYGLQLYQVNLETTQTPSPIVDKQSKETWTLGN